MKYCFLIDCVLGEVEYAAGSVHELDGQAGALALSLKRAVPVQEAPAKNKAKLPATQGELDDAEE